MNHVVVCRVKSSFLSYPKHARMHGASIDRHATNLSQQHSKRSTRRDLDQMWKWKQCEEHETAETAHNYSSTRDWRVFVCCPGGSAWHIFSVVSSVFSALMILWCHASWWKYFDISTVFKYAQLIYLFAVNAFLHFRQVGEPSIRKISIRTRFWFCSMRICVDFAWWFIGAAWNRRHKLHNKFQTELWKKMIK